MSFEQQARDLDAVIRWSGAHWPILVGSSMGAMVALQYLATGGPAVGFVNLDGPVASLREQPVENVDAPRFDEVVRPLYASQFAESLDGLNKLIAAGEGTRGSEALLRRRHLVLADGRVAPRPTAKVAAELFRHAFEQPATELYGRVQVPGLLVLSSRPVVLGATGAARARRVAAQRLQSVNPHFEVIWVDTGHDVQGDAPDLVVGSISAFAHRCGLWR